MPPSKCSIIVMAHFDPDWLSYIGQLLPKLVTLALLEQILVAARRGNLLVQIESSARRPGAENLQIDIRIGSGSWLIRRINENGPIRQCLITQ